VEAESIAKQLWRKAKAGDQAAYEELFVLHVDRLLVFIRAKLGDQLRGKLEAEDVLQDAWASALNSFDQFEYTDEGAFVRWMCRIIENRMRDANDYFNAAKRRQVVLPRSALTGPSTCLNRAENQAAIETALQELSPDHRDVILLRYFEGLTAEEAGERMNRSAGAVRNLTSRALIELGTHLGTDRK